MTEKIVEFIRKKDFVLKKELGQGACGRTVLLYDSVIDEQFVCKKYSPFHESMKEEFFKNFVREIKYLHLLNHQNVVRVFNYYLYPEQRTGYILMEYVQGFDIEDYLSKHPEDVNEVFVQVIEGFSHLEKNKILHRDIRPQNVMVTEDGAVKIIDFGFGKQTINTNDFGKSITLNWWCEPPPEFKESIYDYRTEVYFVGKLFEKIIADADIKHFKHMSLLGRMCVSNPKARIAFFSEVRKELLSEKFLDIGFDDAELETYRDFSGSLYSAVSKIEGSTKYYDDVGEIQTKLEECYKKVMLEEHVPDSSLVVRCFINGQYYYNKSYWFRVDVLRAFLDLYRSSSREKKNIIVGNIQTRLDAVKRYDKPFDSFDDDIPF
ncbi:protein kinase family protein [Sideroxydans sp. CL21]|uniref:protein kinase family protein n=1 Tax=Sideroxydans sp. CL21 TaxID=2600596 RepID=UPI0024BD4BA5|nr:protein kinase family protein [Sideroxydans sp. CL21]